ncbi:hypothetical protein [Egbenema bharatensis]|uniref:hypothetical protein n=1 Tax=Egbenema bharatensis TaxID=3463334 RepID=UPI003A842DC6
MNLRSHFPRSVFPSLLAASAALLLISCGRSSEVSSTATTPSADETIAADLPSTETPSTPTVTQTTSAADKTLISARGIGDARLGMSLGELKDILGDEAEFTVESPFMVDFDAIAVRQNDEVAYYILYLAGETLTDADVIQGLLTDNPTFQTAEGIGTGTSIAEAEQTYGSAHLSYNTLNESREYARFQNQPANNISFATGNGNQELAGIYAEPADEYNETEAFREDATIQSVLVICLSEVCAPPGSN